MTERRRSFRFNLSLPVKVRCRCSVDGPSRDGTTRDISDHGVYLILSGDRLNVAAELELEVTLPGLVAGSTDVFVRALVKIVRVEELTQNGEPLVGLAAVI